MIKVMDDDDLRTQVGDLAEELDRISAQPMPLTQQQRIRLTAILAAARETFTVVGAWMGSDPVPVAVIRGEHPVEGGRWSAFPEGLWATSVDATDAYEAERAAVAEMKGDDGGEGGACPVCGAGGDDSCVSSNGRLRSDHAARTREG